LAQRALTALVGIPVLLSAVWWGPPWLTLLVLVAALLGVREVYNLTPPGVSRLPFLLGALWAIALVLGGQAASSAQGLLLTSLGISLAGSFVAILWLIAFYRGPNMAVAGCYLIGAPLYVGFLLAHALVLRDLGNGDSLGRNWLLFALLVTFAADTGAFFTGRSIGRHRMAPRISPQKTWEGAAGGFILSVAAAIALGQLLELDTASWRYAGIGATVGVVSQLGDLFESKLKRLAHAKDAGSIVPGHGGILDRLDSVVFSIPAVYYLVAMEFPP
jgi:phosphatidate cytidylyltransferase